VPRRQTLAGACEYQKPGCVIALVLNTAVRNSQIELTGSQFASNRCNRIISAASLAASALLATSTSSIPG